MRYLPGVIGNRLDPRDHIHIRIHRELLRFNLGEVVNRWPWKIAPDDIGYDLVIFMTMAIWLVTFCWEICLLGDVVRFFLTMVKTIKPPLGRVFLELVRSILGNPKRGGLHLIFLGGGLSRWWFYFWIIYPECTGNDPNWPAYSILVQRYLNHKLRFDCIAIFFWSPVIQAGFHEMSIAGWCFWVMKCRERKGSTMA